MKKTVTINISGQMFFIDEDAYKCLQSYLTKIEATFRNQESGDEIITDIESRIAEIFNERIKRETGVVSINLVHDVIATMGEPEQFEEDKGHEQTEYTKPDAIIYPKSRKRFFRDIDKRVLGGVCAGIANYFNIDVLLVRIIALLLVPFTSGAIILIYAVLWIALPPARTTAQKLEMRGENITINNIEKTIRDEYDEVKRNFDKFKDSSTYKKGENFFQKFGRRDKTTLIIIAVIIGAALFLQMPHFNGLIQAPGAMFASLSYHVVPTFNHIFFPGALTFVLILLVIGLIFKTVFKIILYIIAFLLLGSLALKVVFWLFGGFLLMC